MVGKKVRYLSFCSNETQEIPCSILSRRCFDKVEERGSGRDNIASSSDIPNRVVTVFFIPLDIRSIVGNSASCHQISVIPCQPIHINQKPFEQLSNR